jgi:uncharacterized protein
MPPLLTDPWFYATALPAVTLYGFSKGGFSGVSLLSIPLMSLVMSPVQAATILLPVLIVQDAVTVTSYRKTWDMTALLYIMPGTLLGLLLAWLTASVVSQTTVRLAVGVIALLFCLNAWVLLPRRAKSLGDTGSLLPHQAASAWLLGTCSGYASFIVHAGAPPFLLYMAPRLASKELLIGTMSIVFTVVNLLKVPAYLALGQFSSENLIAAAVLLPMAIAANMGGVWLVRRLSPVLFFRVVSIITFCVGLYLIFQSLSDKLGSQ